MAFDRDDVTRHRKTRPETCSCASIPRSDLARIIEAIWQGGARVLVLDMSLEQSCTFGLGTAKAHDQPLVDALDGPGETVVAVAATASADTTYFDEPAGELRGPVDRPHLIASPLVYEPWGVVRGVDLVQTGSPSSIDEDSTQPLELVGMTLPPLSLAAWAAWHHRGHEVPAPHGNDYVECGDARIPVWESASVHLLEGLMGEPQQNRHAMLINWAGPVGTFPIYRASYARAVAAAGNTRTLQMWFADRIVIVGSGVERLDTPLLGRAEASRGEFLDQSGAVSMTGLEVHANALQTLLQQRFIEPVSGLACGVTVLIGSLLAALAFRFRRTYEAVGIVVAELTLLPLIAMALIRIDVWFYVAIPAAAALTSGSATAVWGYARSLRRADELAEAVAEREAATATIVHDLKQPLAAISTMAQVLRRRSSEDEDEIEPELANRIMRQVESALADIDDLLIASPDRNLPLNTQQFDIAALARDLAVAQQLKSDVHEVEVIAPANGLTVCGDPRYLGRMLSNLVDNAIKYWPEGGTVVVELEEMSGHAIIRVVDGGIGMDEKQQSSCFERYHRAVPEEYGIPGTGIGLYSVQRVVRAHGGRVQVVSAPGAGSTFVVMLPLREPGGCETSEVRLT